MKISPVLRKMLTKTCAAVAACLVFSATAAAQVSLRTAIDYDGDSKADPAVFRPSNNTWYVNKSNGGFIFQSFGVANTDLPAPGDYDGDGKGDIAVFRDTDGTFYFLRSSNNSFGAQQWGITGDEPVARKWDSDNITDFAVVRRSNGNMFWYIRSSAAVAAGQSGFVAVQFGIATDFVAPGNYAGDDAFEVAVQRPSANNGQANFYYMSTNGTNFAGVQWGLSNDFVVPGDYDGDGRTDIAVVREVSGNLAWYIRLSTTSGLKAVNFGTAATDFLAQNDYDGDGKTDVAVWRDSNGTFYAEKSNGTGIFAAQWGASQDFPIASYDTH